MAQKLIRCEAGHIYDSAAHTTCPECGEPQDATCERGHSYDPTSHPSCPTCQQEDRARPAQSRTDNARGDSGKGDSKKKEPQRTGLWLGIAAAVLALAASGGYFLFSFGNQETGARSQQTTSTEKAEERKGAKTGSPAADQRGVRKTPPDREKAAESQTTKKDDKPSSEPVEEVKKEPVDSDREKQADVPESQPVKDSAQEKSQEKSGVAQEEHAAPTGDTQRIDTGTGGDAKAQYERGLAYEKGDGVTQDTAQAVTWYRKAADQGYTEAEYRLGLSYQLGRGVNQDYAEAAKWYQRAAQQGFPDAQNDLGVLYVKGNGVARDYGIAARWYQKAAAQGHRLAQSNLGYLYANGRGVPKDEAEAVRLYTASAEQGHAQAQYNLAKMYEKGEGVRQNHAAAFKWLQAAAKQDHRTAQNDLGVLYWKGLGVTRDYKAAAEWFQKAAEQGLTIAQSNTGDMYARGQGVEKNPYEALKWYRAAVKNGHTMKENQLGKSGLTFKTSTQLECNGIGVELTLNASWDGQTQSCTLGATQAVASSACSRAVGTWSWSSRGTVTIAGNGTMSHTPGPGSFVPIGAGQWTCSADGQIVLRWDGGQFVDHMTLSRDGNRLSGRNQLGWRVIGTRQYAQRSFGVQPPPGIQPPPQRRTRR